MPYARNTDPETSHDAAASIREINRTQASILQALLTPATDVEIIERYRRITGAPLASDSGIRSRRAELVTRGMVQDSGRRAILESGRKAIIWEATWLAGLWT
jgi:hypothetical protein